MQSLDQDAALADCGSLLDALRDLPECTGRVGALGYCLGGKLAFLLGARNKVDSAISYYGVGIQEQLKLLPEVRVPTLLFIAEEDVLCPPPAQQHIKMATAENNFVSIESFPEAGHAFARTGSTSYRQDAAERADNLAIRFLEQYLDG
jgi:carboxymethylenebutenolidase